MCLVAIAHRAHPSLALVVAANRDEWRDRPAEAARFWPEHPDLLAGRDLEADGTWMGVTRARRFAAVTNYRDPSERGSGPRSRGELVTSFLTSDLPAAAFVEALAKRAGEYRAFNLLVSDGARLVCFESRAGAVREVSPGVHALSNHTLDEPWPKVTRAREAMGAAIAQGGPDEVALFAMLSDAAPAPDDALPDTGVGLAWERRLSPPLITGADYGTRVSTVLSIAASGEVRFEERTRAADGAVVSAVTFSFG